jgi:signal transduction histidine kinase/ligand-binding sensor domain-containing protein
MSIAARVVCAALMAAAAPPAAALDPARSPSQYVIRKWGASALSTNSVHSLLQSPDGYLWVGTTTGLARFDGARFTFFENRRTPGLPDGGVSALTQGADGSLYLGTTGGEIARYRDGAFTPIEGRPWGGVVASLHFSRDGSLWVGAHGRRVYRWKDGLFPTYRTPVPYAMAEDAAGVVWFGFGTADGGLSRFDGTQIVAEGLAGEIVQALCFDKTGALWIGTPRGLRRRRHGRLERFSTHEGLGHENVTALLEDRDGQLWVGTNGGGLYRYASSRFTRLTTAEGLSSDYVHRLLEDHEGNVWVATADGLNCLSNARFLTYGHLEGLAHPAVSAIAPGAGGRVWIGTTSSGVALLEGGRLTRFPLPRGPASDAVTAMHEARDGGLWIAVDNGRLFLLKNGALTEHTPGDTTEKVRLILEDDGGPLFILGGRMARIRARRSEFLEPAEPWLGFPHASYRDKDGTLWLATSIGLFRVRDGKRELLDEKSGLPDRRVRSLTSDGAGGLWLATSAGLAYFKDGKFHAASIAHGLPENYLRLVLADGLGHLWVAAMGRLFRLDTQELLDLFAGRTARVSPVFFDTSDGLRSTEGVLGNGPGFRAEDGRLWFATAQGVSTVDAARIAADEPAAPVRIERFTVDGQTVHDGGVFPFGRGEVAVDYTALALGAAGKLRFRHRLEGLDPAWKEAEDRRAYYSTLPAGSYRFLVEASNRDGRWNGRAASVSFRIRPPFHQTPAFYVLAAGAVFGLAALAHRLRLAQVRARFDAVLTERTRIARELHDTLAQGLAALGLQLDTMIRTAPAEAEPTRSQLQLARAMVKSSLGEVRRSIWVLRAQSSKGSAGLADTVADSLRQLTVGTAVDAAIRVGGQPRPLKAEVERNLLRIAHEAVINAVRHAEAQHVAISLEYEARGLALRVRDDGRGFDPVAHIDASRGRHFGVVGMVERAESLRGRLEVVSRPGAGTEIVCFLPYDGSVDPIAADEDEPR